MIVSSTVTYRKVSNKFRASFKYWDEDNPKTEFQANIWDEDKEELKKKVEQYIDEVRSTKQQDHGTK